MTINELGGLIIIAIATVGALAYYILNANLKERHHELPRTHPATSQRATRPRTAAARPSCTSRVIEGAADRGEGTPLPDLRSELPDPVWVWDWLGQRRGRIIEPVGSGYWIQWFGPGDHQRTYTNHEFTLEPIRPANEWLFYTDRRLWLHATAHLNQPEHTP